MRRLAKTSFHALVPMLLLSAALAAVDQDTAPQRDAASQRAVLQKIRTFSTVEQGLRHPVSITWSDELGGLVLTGVEGGRTTLRALLPDETQLGGTTFPSGDPGQVLAENPLDGTLTVGTGEGAVSVPARTVVSNRAAEPQSAVVDVPASAAGAAYDDRGRLHVLADGVLTVAGGARAQRLPQAVADHDLRGLAAGDPGELLTYDATAEALLVLRGGRVAERVDAAEADLQDVRGVAYGPSADPTDDPSVTSFYLLDDGRPGDLGEMVEATVQTDLLAVAAVQPSAVRTVATSSWSPPSPDPSGITYLPSADRMFVSDGEVDEMSIFRGANFYVTNRQALTVESTGVSQPWSDEPTGVGYNPTNNHMFVSDDDEQEVYEIVPGTDGRFGTGDDTVTSFDTAGRGNTDPEGVEADPVTSSVWTVDGVGAEVFRVRAGTDGRFGTGDDVSSHFDIGKYGAQDPEGIAYDSVRDTLVVVDGASQRIYELTRDGALLNTVDIASVNMLNAAGLTIAPASNGSSQRNYYVVARGVDNNSSSSENDGRLYEITAGLPPLDGGPVNQPPTVNAGNDFSVTLPATASLDGTVTDDGLPNPPAAVTTTWSQVSGPGTVTFGNTAAVDTTASFSSPGTYVLQLTAGDSQATSADEVTVNVAPVGGATVVERRVAAGSDDAEQASSGSVSLSSSDLELVTDGSTVQTVGVRFANLAVPKGATITSAYVQFTADEVSTGAASMTIQAEASDNAGTFTSASGGVTSRATTTAAVGWSPADWPTIGQAGAAQRTSDISALVGAVVGRAGWASGNALALHFTGTGRRTAEAFEGGASLAPLLHVEYSTGGGGPVNQPPTVDAGLDATVTLPATASLDGTVTDDGAVTTVWSKTSGPGTVTFGNAAAVDTTASFSEAGELRAAADRGRRPVHRVRRGDGERAGALRWRRRCHRRRASGGGGVGRCGAGVVGFGVVEQLGPGAGHRWFDGADGRGAVRESGGPEGGHDHQCLRAVHR